MKRALSVYCLLLFSACVDRIPFDTGPSSPTVVIYGQFSGFEKDHKVTVGITRGFGKDESPVNNAMVRVVDDDGNSASYLAVGEGEYILPKESLFKGTVGRFYHLEVTMENGSIYRSTPQLLPEPIPVSDVNFQLYYREEVSTAGVVISKPYLKILVDSKTSYRDGEGARLRWFVQEEYLFIDIICGPFDVAGACHFRLPLDNTNFTLLETETSKQQEVIGLQVFERDLTPQYQFNFKHVFNVFQLTMTEQTYDYWEKIKVVSNQSGSIFDRQPAGVVGNLTSNDPNELVLGYFEVVGESVGRVSVVPDQLKPLQIIPACIDFIPFYQNGNDFCCVCSLIGDELIPPPDYFLEE